MNEVTPEIVLAKIDELIELLKSVETTKEPVDAIHTWRTALKGAEMMREHWDKNVIHRKEVVENLISSVLGIAPGK